MPHLFTHYRCKPFRTPGSGVSSLATLVMLVLFVASIGAVGYWWQSTQGQQAEGTNAILHTVSRSDFVHQLTERGEILSSGVTEIRSKVKTKNTPGVAILRIIAEGTQVEEGDFLVELDASALESERTSQQIMVNTAEAVVIEARNLYETAVIAQKEYVEGTYIQERQTIESEIFVAEENLNRAKEYFAYSKKLASKGYVNELQLEADQFAVEKYLKELEAAQTKLKVLDEFTRAKMEKQLESDVLISKAKWEAVENSLSLDIQKLKDIEKQITRCMILAPRGGTVVYAHERNHHGEGEFVVKEGAVVRERQEILRMPNPDAMQVAITINESLVQYVKKGMEAVIVPVGLDGLELRGTVSKVNKYAEPANWWRANVKEYKASIDLDQTHLRLRAGMTASVTIRCSVVPDAMQVPVQAVYTHGDQFYCFVYSGKSWQAKAIECGPTNDNFFVVESGLQVSDRVALNPRRFLQLVDLPDLPPEERQRAVPQRSGPPRKVAGKRASRSGG